MRDSLVFMKDLIIKGCSLHIALRDARAYRCIESAQDDLQWQGDFDDPVRRRERITEWLRTAIAICPAMHDFKEKIEDVSRETPDLEKLIEEMFLAMEEGM